MAQNEKAARMCAVVTAHPHADAELIAQAFELLAKSLTVFDSSYPSPEMRSDVARARQLSTLHRDANTARDFIETGV